MSDFAKTAQRPATEAAQEASTAVDDVHLQAPGLLFEERAGARSALLVEREGLEPAARADLQPLRLVPPDLDHPTGLRVEPRDRAGRREEIGLVVCPLEAGEAGLASPGDPESEGAVDPLEEDR